MITGNYWVFSINHFFKYQIYFFRDAYSPEHLDLHLGFGRPDTLRLHHAHDTGANLTKLFTTVIYDFSSKLKGFHWQAVQLSLNFSSKAGACPNGAPDGSSPVG
jgi:hypothetical protein